MNHAASMKSLGVLRSATKRFSFYSRNIKHTLHTASSGSSTVGFIGLGNMGGHMAVNLAKSGCTIHAFDTSSDRIRLVKNMLGNDLCKNIVEHPTVVDLFDSVSPPILVTMLPASAQVFQVYCNEENGVIYRAKPDTLFIDCTTGDPGVSKQVDELATAKNCLFVDAPVSGGVPAAENARLTFMVGGTDEAVARASPVLMKMGKQIFHCGPVGAGLVSSGGTESRGVQF